ncbi:hypothetical protein MJM83_28415, partial [Salmonella enterica subsp. enterica serovar Montevideo]|nr:hypothetical protein [Salmonella enterica subsp. enterica serovar Montevideo]
KMDVKGSGAITDLTDNLFIIWRNKARERALQRVYAGEQINEKDQQLCEETFRTTAGTFQMNVEEEE